ncbi:MAG: sugar phosphate nucleotidyltransferase [Firmicutes bacterium]|nr:sugar phosphate nucleotidyltransferase [Bacillota bacterium]
MFNCLVLAAGEGTRMRSNCPKVLSEILHVPMLSWVLDSVFACKTKKCCVVTGFQSEKIDNFLKINGYNCETVFQKDRKGTAHAVMVAIDFIKKNSSEDILILGGDSPFVDPMTIMSAYECHKKEKNCATLISAKFSDPFGYGRIIRNRNGQVCAIVEEKEADKKQKYIQEINSGAYWFNSVELINAIGSVHANNTSGEFYLTSIISIFIKNNLKVGAFCSQDYVVALGANTSKQLKMLNEIAKNRVIKRFMSSGVNIPYNENIMISKNVEIGEGTTILSGVTIVASKIGKNCVIGPNTKLFGENVPDGTNLMFHNTNVDFTKYLEKGDKFDNKAVNYAV